MIRSTLFALTLLMFPVAAMADDMAGMDMKPAAPKATANGAAADAAYAKAMQKMMQQGDAAKPIGDPDHDFVVLMTPHHEAAVEMAKAYLKYGKDPVLTKLATNIIRSQDAEIRLMQEWLKKRGH